MGLFAFNRMRLRRVEEMRPENIEAPKKEVKKQEPIKKEEEPKTTRRGRRK